uniref:tRNA-uridine aminocarboxypropyltransferase n=1 Tax=Strigamia maritima TaxID=126957 RepID=T1JFS3_STRMM
MTEEEELFDELVRDFAALPADPPIKRDICLRCCRPVSVCWCFYLPDEPVVTRSTVIILQHPSEEKRCLRTAPILLAALARGKCHIVHGRKFTTSKSALLENVLTCRHSLLLFPGPDAVDVADVPRNCTYNLILLDGTWAQARSIYHTNPSLQRLRQVKLCHAGVSEYVIRTQPDDNCLSTVESAALALAYLENDPSIRDTLLRPLQALCNFQLQHGAVEHQSKEFLFQNGKIKRKKKK